MKKLILRFINSELYDALKKSAEKNRRSLNSEILQAIEFYLSNANEAKPKKEVKKQSPK
jgi:hypothetical protein